RRDLRDRGALGDDPGVFVQTLRATRVPHGADPSPLRDEGVVRDEDHGAVLDRRRPAVRGRVRPVLPLLLQVVSAVEEALLEAARLEGDKDVLVLGGGSLALGAQKRLRDGWVYVVRCEVDELEELLGQAHAVGATGVAYLVGEASVLPLPDDAVAAALGRVP